MLLMIFIQIAQMQCQYIILEQFDEHCYFDTNFNLSKRCSWHISFRSLNNFEDTLLYVFVFFETKTCTC